MSRVVVIGGRSAGGSAGRTAKAPSAVTSVTADLEAEEAAGAFGARIAALCPEAVIDLICFTQASARQLIEAVNHDQGALARGSLTSLSAFSGPAAVTAVTAAWKRYIVSA